MADSPRLIDTHCHLYDPQFGDGAEVVMRALEAGVDRLIVIGIDPATCDQAIELAERFEGVYAVVGLHPNHAATYTSLGFLEEGLRHPKVVALGEIGLDFHWNYATLEQQTRALMDQLSLAHETGKPVVFHCREAYPALLEILEGLAEVPKAVFHCFGGDSDDARRALDLGFLFGLDGPLTYKKNDALRLLAASLPLDRILLETDAPYLPPEPYRGKRNEPAYVRLVAERLATVRGITLEAVAEATTANAVSFFGIEG